MPSNLSLLNSNSHYYNSEIELKNERISELHLKKIINQSEYFNNQSEKFEIFNNITSYDIDNNLLLNNLIKREKIGTTTIGNGIAIPHVQNDQISNPLCIVTILSQGLDFDALDNNPVDLIVFLILPDWSKSENLQILAQVSRLLRNSEITDKLRGCKSEESAFAIISQHLKNKAA